MDIYEPTHKIIKTIAYDGNCAALNLASRTDPIIPFLILVVNTAVTAYTINPTTRRVTDFVRAIGMRAASRHHFLIISTRFKAP